MKSVSNRITMILSVIGFLVAALLVAKHFQPDLAPCGTIGDCHGALNSDYGHVGPIPTAVFGAGMYAVLFALCLLRGRALSSLRSQETAAAAAYATAGASPDSEATGEPPTTPGVSDSTLPLRKQVGKLDMGIWLLALAGTGISFWLQYVAIFQLLSFCPYCFTSACTITLIFLLATRDYLIDGRKLSGEQKMLGGILAFIAVMMTFMIWPNVQEQIAAGRRANPKPVDVTPTIDRTKIITSDVDIKGDKNAKYMLVEFADYQCPACHRAVKLAEDILKTHPDIKLIFRNFPLPMHKFSREAAAAAEAARLQGKFWPMHDMIYENQEAMEKPDFNPDKAFSSYAEKLGLDVAKFDKDRQSSATEEHIQTDVDSATAGGVNMTPSFFFVSPTQIWRFAGTNELITALADKTHKMWQ